MGIITEISRQRTKNRVNIFVDNEFKSGLDFESAVKFGLKVGKEIDDEYLNKVIEESETNSAFNVSLNFISAVFKSKYEVKQKLLKKGFTENVIERTLKKLEEYHYIDDYEYAKLYINSVSNKSKREISEKLRIKGVSKDIIQELLSEVDDESEESNAFNYAVKYLKNKILDDKTKRNLIANLMRKGYSYDLTIKILSRIEQED